MNEVLIKEAKQKASEWCQAPFDSGTQSAVKQLLDQADQTELIDSFFKDLAFGTGGIRGVVGHGTNRINRYTLGRCTQGVSNYLNQITVQTTAKVAIAYDTRMNSQVLAKEVAGVFSANGIEVFLFESYRPTPELSFAIRHLNCHCGIVITASHNPPKYNGYKVYWRDGAQVVPPIDAALIGAIEELAYSEINFQGNSDLIHEIGQDIDVPFIQNAITSADFGSSDKDKSDVKIVFSPLHGSTLNIMSEAFAKAGYKNFHIVAAQTKTDGLFDTVKSPNPEDPAAFNMGIVDAKVLGADLVMATDPDGDRLGVCVQAADGSYQLLDGNQLMCLLLHFVLRKTTLKPNNFVASTIVSSPMFHAIASDFGVSCYLGLTGFKWIAKMIEDFADQSFLFGGEESFGYMVGDFVRDKDAITAALLVANLTTELKQQGKTLLDALIDLYMQYGLYYSKLHSITKEGFEGLSFIQNAMARYRAEPPQTIGGLKLVQVYDYAQPVHYLTPDQQLPTTDLLIFEFEGGARIALRPSGTEPKLKIYINLKEQLSDRSLYQQTYQKLYRLSETIIHELNIT